MNKHYTIKDLQSRYSIQRNALYKRFPIAGIVAKKEGNNSYFDETDIKKLDDLEYHLSLGGNFKTYTPMSISVLTNENQAIEITTDNSLKIQDRDTEPINVRDETLNKLFTLILDSKTNLIAETKAKYELLEYLADNNIIIPTKEVREIIGKKPKCEVYNYGSYQFKKAGKIGNSSAWKTLKNPT